MNVNHQGDRSLIEIIFYTQMIWQKKNPRFSLDLILYSHIKIKFPRGYSASGQTFETHIFRVVLLDLQCLGLLLLGLN